MFLLRLLNGGSVPHEGLGPFDGLDLVEFACRASDHFSILLTDLKVVGRSGFRSRLEQDVGMRWSAHVLAPLASVSAGIGKKGNRGLQSPEMTNPSKNEGLAEKRLMGIEPTSQAWEAWVIAIIRQAHLLTLK